MLLAKLSYSSGKKKNRPCLYLSGPILSQFLDFWDARDSWFLVIFTSFALDSSSVERGE